MALPKKRKRNKTQAQPGVILTKPHIPTRCGICAKRMIAFVGDQRQGIVAPPWHCGECREYWLDELKKRLAQEEAAAGPPPLESKVEIKPLTDEPDE